MAFHLSDLKRSGHREPGQSPSSYPVTVPHSVQLRRCPKPILSHTPDRLGHAVAGDDYWAYGTQSPCWIFVSASLAASAKEPVQCCVSFIIIIIGTLGISGGTVRRSRLLARLLRCPPRRDSATGTPRSAEQGVRLAVARASYIPVGTIQPRQCAAGGFSMISRRLALVRTTSSCAKTRPF